MRCSRRPPGGWAASAVLLAATLQAFGQASPAPAPTSPSISTPSPAVAPGEPPPAPDTPRGEVLFQSHGEPPEPTDAPDPNRKLLPVPAEQAGGTPEVTDRERGSLTFTGYDLDVRITPLKAALSVRARITLRNDGSEPLRYIPLQISSSLLWESVSLLAVGPAVGPAVPLNIDQHTLDTDADHTGKATEAVVTLPAPLAPGATLQLDTIYSGTVRESAERLLRIGASPAQALAADWDLIGPDATFLRGFGNVLWYPIAAPQLFLGEGNRLFDSIGQTKLREQASSIRLSLSVEYAGEPPTAAYFCGRRADFKAVSDTPDAPVSAGGGVAHAEFAAEPLGFRVPSLFVVPRPETLVAPSLALESLDDTAAPALGNAVSRVDPLLTQWLGARPLSALTLLDHPGQPFEDGPLLVAPASGLEPSTAEPALTFSLTHAWVQSGRPWVDEGLAQFFALLDVEQNRGRDAMVARLAELMAPVALAESAPDAAPTVVPSTVPSEAPTAPPLAAEPGPTAMPPDHESGQALPSATSELFFRNKAAAVWAMLRDIVGDRSLQITLQAWRLRPPAGTSADEDALVLEGQLERDSGQDLHAFFADWIFHDRGLPDLTIAGLDSRQLPDSETGRRGGFLTAVTVRNSGGAMADVPVVVSSGSFSATARLSIPARSAATARLQTETAPTEIQVNDGITPEIHSSLHRRTLQPR